ncbi:ATP-binding protein [Antribacter gilvus]|uniref:ATP-binding protein n=1 Tax=Antribacter gilvus TaxID=2304675 RepID=UPI000F7A936D|nr:ATP-binding protein [Antribacter gilvus]
MRERVRTATLTAVYVAVLLLGLPLAVFGAKYVYAIEEERVHTRAVDVAVWFENRSEQLAEEDPATVAQVSEYLEARAAGQDSDLTAYIQVTMPDGNVYQTGEPPAEPNIEEAANSEEGRLYVIVQAPAWPAYVKASYAVVLVALACAAAIAAGYIMASWLANRLAAPFVYLAASAELLGSGQVRPQFEPTNVEEIDLVAAELARSADRLASRLAVERQFTSDASHQLRTPLTALTMRLEEITLLSTEPEVQEEARISLEQVERLVGVVDDLLARSRKAQGGTTETVDLSVVLRQQEEEWRPTFEKEGRHLAVEVPEDLQVLATPGALAQVLSTLIENSLKYGDGTTTLRARLSGNTGAVAVEVADEGPGVTEELAGQIFERGVTSGAGTGLGLALARDLVTADGGRLELSQRNPAVFSVFLAGIPKSYDPHVVLPVGSTFSTPGIKRRRFSWR